MTTEFLLPELGEDIETGDVVNIMVSEGDNVSKDQPLMEIETDKAVIELPSPVDGVVKKIAVKSGDTINVGQHLITFEDLSKSGFKDSSENKKKNDAKSNDELSADEEEIYSDKEHNDVDDENKIKAKEKSKLKEKIETDDEETDAKVIKLSRKEENEMQEYDHKVIPASPSIRRLAREIGVNISNVKGTGPGGRITDEDIKQYSQDKLASIENKSDERKAEIIEHVTTDDKRIIIEEMSKVRQLTAERLSQSWKAPHVTQHDKADITAVEEYRKGYGSKLKESGIRLTMTSIIIKIVCHALKKFQKFNCSIDMDNKQIVYKNYINIGIAVDTDRGLLVPVIKDADKKNLIEISQELTDLSERSRNKKIKVEELQDSTFTITNLGGIGGTYFTPVIYSPNVAILGVSRSVVEPVFINGEFKPRLMIPLSLSYDHRIIDGADAARFTRWIVDALESPINALLNT